jgi:hypothetical protein
MWLSLVPTLSRAEDIRWTTDWVIKKVPPLKNDYAGRLPMITWPAFALSTNDKSFYEKKPFPPDVYKELAKRGLTQRIPLNTNYVAMAQAIQQAGGKIVFVEGSGGNAYYELAPDWGHKLPEGFKITEGDRLFPCPTLLEGWRIKADEVRATLRAYKAAGVKVDGVWMDWECEPLVWSIGRYEQAKACSRCQALLPAGVLDTKAAYTTFIMGLRADIFSAYLAAPVQEIFPGCPVTQWEAVISTPERPTQSCWGNWKFPPMTLGLMTAANPVAYGNDYFYQAHWSTNWGYPLDEKHMDRLYTRIMFGQVSQHARNALLTAPEKLSIPWVCRYCPDVDDDKVPILSRERYREILRHIWLRGADSMQIFNEPRPKHPAIAVEEIQDAVAVYDEMLPYRRFLDRGAILNTDVPEVTDDGAIWSGLRLENEALVRAFTQGRKRVEFAITPWTNAPPVELIAHPDGQTYRLVLQEGKVKVTKERTP